MIINKSFYAMYLLLLFCLCDRYVKSGWDRDSIVVILLPFSVLGAEMNLSRFWNLSLFSFITVILIQNACLFHKSRLISYYFIFNFWCWFLWLFDVVVDLIVDLLTICGAQLFFYSILWCFRQIGGLYIFLYTDQRLFQGIEWARVQHLLFDLFGWMEKKVRLVGNDGEIVIYLFPLAMEQSNTVPWRCLGTMTWGRAFVFWSFQTFPDTDACIQNRKGHICMWENENYYIMFIE